MNTNTLAYACPHCGTHVDVPDEYVGGTVPCPNPACARPFQPLAPAAPMPQMADEVTEPRATESAQHQMEDEHALQVAHPVMFRKHPVRYLFCVTLVLGGIATVAASFVAPPVGVDPNLLLGAGLLAAVLGIGFLSAWALRTLSTKLVITNQRTILRHGIIARQTTEVRHNDVRNLQVKQGVIDRILGIGDLAVSSAGQDDLEIEIRGIANPHRLAEKIRECQNLSPATTQ